MGLRGAKGERLASEVAMVRDSTGADFGQQGGGYILIGAADALRPADHN